MGLFYAEYLILICLSLNTAFALRRKEGFRGSTIPKSDLNMQ